MTVRRLLLLPLVAVRAVVRFPVVVLARLWRFLISARGVALLTLTFLAGMVAFFAVSNRHAPYTADAYVQAYVVQVAAQIEGQITGVDVVENQRVKAGQTLFRIDPRPFEHKVAALEAKLALAKSQVAQLERELVAVRAEGEGILAGDDYATAVLKQESAIFKNEATTERRYLDAVQKRKTAQAARERHKAVIQKAEDALAARVGAEHALVAEATALLNEARLDLSWTTVPAPVDGYVTNVQLRPGAYAHAGRPVMTCIDDTHWWVVANFRENGLENVRPGQTAGLTFNTYPGRVFSGTVESVGWGVGEGQGVPSGELPAVHAQRAWLRPAQRFQVRVRPELPAGFPLRVGTTATVTVYAHPDHEVAEAGRWWQQVVAWFDYIY
jgi:multidrug resistance efflux pump